MPKGLFTQSACVLLSRETSLDEIAPLLSEFTIAKRTEPPANPNFGGPSLLIPYRPEVKGCVSVEARSGKWPDHMGDAKTEFELFGAWSMGFFGPFTFPGNLQRATEQLWAWPEGKEVANRHTAFIQIKVSYISGAEMSDPVIPAGYDPLPELHFMTRVVLALLKHPAALAYFNPNGEVLANEKVMRDSLEYHEKHQIPPFDLWSNIRLFNPNNGWLIMDTVGMGQFDRPDLEACFPAKVYNNGEVSRFLRNCCLYLLKNGEVIKHKDTMNGPGGINWRGYHMEKPVCPPPRRTIRWFPQDGSKPPPEMFPEEPKLTLSQRLGGLFGRGK